MEIETRKVNKTQRLAYLGFSGYVLILFVLVVLSEFTPLNLPELDYFMLMLIPLLAFQPDLGYNAMIPKITFRKVSMIYTVLVWILLILLNLFKLFSLSFPYQKLVYILIIPIIALHLYMGIKLVRTIH